MCKPTAKWHIIITIIKAIKLDSTVQMQHSVWTHAIKHPPLTTRDVVSSEWQVTGIWKSENKKGTRKENTYGIVFRTFIKVVLQADFTKPLIGGDSVIALCVTPTVWIISLVNPFLKGVFAGRNTWIYCTVGQLCIHIHWLWPLSFRKRNNNTLKWHSHSCKLTQSHQHYLAGVRKSIGLNH